jgi:hypothetical protein
MRRRRSLIVWLCLLALVWCQVAMAAHACNGGDTAVGKDCHGTMDDADPAAGSNDCPAQDLTPDLGKLPTIAPLPGHAVFFLPRAADSARFTAGGAQSRARAGPHLAALCQLLI